MVLVAKYVGHDEYVNGVPARDLDEEVWALLDEDAKERARASKVYDFSPVVESVPEPPAPVAEVVDHAGTPEHEEVN